MRPNQARLDLEALRQNLALARELAPQSRVMAVVKANAYGHGAVTIASALDSLVDALAVACVEEALELREAGIDSPILLLQGVFDATELSVAALNKLWITIENEKQLAWLEQAQLPSALQCWLKIDTGMHRLGLLPILRGEAPADSHRDFVRCEYFDALGETAERTVQLVLAALDLPEAVAARHHGQALGSLLRLWR